MSKMQGGLSVLPFFRKNMSGFGMGGKSTPSISIFVIYAVLKRTFCTLAVKHRELYMRVEVSLGQDVHGRFIIAQDSVGAEFFLFLISS
jgi:hypothetical protein